MGCGSSKLAALQAKMDTELAALKAHADNEQAARSTELQDKIDAMAQQLEIKAAVSVDPQATCVSILDEAIFAHLGRVLQIPKEEPQIREYAAALRAEGCDTPEDFDDITIEELKEAPFNFKRLHLKKVARSRGRQNEQKGGHPPQSDRDAQQPQQGQPVLRNSRGQCSLCGLDVYDTQPRQKDPHTDRYQHQACCSDPDAARNPSTADEAAAAAAAAAEEAQAEVAAIVAAGNAARAEAVAEATKQAAADAADAAAVAAVAAAAAAAAAVATAAATAAEAQAEVAAIMAAADSARAEAIAEANKQAQAAVAQAQADAVLIVAAATPSNGAGGATPSMGSSHTPHAAEAPTTPLLPDGMHAFLSYQWDVQDQVKEIKELLNDRNIKCWMDIDGGMKADIYDSMAEGVQGAACVVCFMTQAYQDSANCKLELKFAQQSGVPIIPVMMQAKFAARGWLAILTAGSIWTPMHEPASVRAGVGKLIEQAQHLVPGMHGFEDASGTPSGASEGGALSVGKEELFSVGEMRGELDRLRTNLETITGNNAGASTVAGEACQLPAIVPQATRGIWVSPEMTQLLEIVSRPLSKGTFSGGSTPSESESESAGRHIGFFGMGGIGKSTTSAWIVRNEAIRKQFGTICWIPLGQTPDLDRCQKLLFLQMTGREVPSDLGPAEQEQALLGAFTQKNVLLVLDDCWNIDHAARLTFLDDTSSSKLLVSSRVRNVLEGCVVVEIQLPNEETAVSMLMTAAGPPAVPGASAAALSSAPQEARSIVRLCNLLPLAIGIAGAMVRELGLGNDWEGVATMLQEELKSGSDSNSVQSSVLRTSLKGITGDQSEETIRLFYSFALVPEDMQCSLQALSYLYAAEEHARRAALVAEGGPAFEFEAADAKIPPLLHVRRWLKQLIDHGLVLGPVDSPSLHDFVLDFVTEDHQPEELRTAHKTVMDIFRTHRPPGLRGGWCPAAKAIVGGAAVYACNALGYHVRGAIHGCSPEVAAAIVEPWLTDIVVPVDAVTTWTSHVLGKDAVIKLAEYPEASGDFWKAGVLWSAAASLIQVAEGFAGSFDYFCKAGDALDKVNPDVAFATAADRETYVDLVREDAKQAIMAWNQSPRMPLVISRIEATLTPDVQVAQPVEYVLFLFLTQIWPTFAQGKWLEAGAVHYKQMQACKQGYLSGAYRGEVAMLISYSLSCWCLSSTVAAPEFDWDAAFGEKGYLVKKALDIYNYDLHHDELTKLCSCDWIGDSFGLLLPTLFHYGDMEVVDGAFTKLTASMQRLVADSVYNPGGEANAVWCGAAMQSQILLLAGRNQDVLDLFDLVECDPSRVDAYMKRTTDLMPLLSYHDSDKKLAPGSAVCSDGFVWHFKIVHMLALLGVAREAAVATSTTAVNADLIAAGRALLGELPSLEEFVEMYMGIPSVNSFELGFGMTSFVWQATLCEMLGEPEKGLPYAEKATCDDVPTGGSKNTLMRIFGHACCGRLLAAMGRDAEAAVAFEAGVALGELTGWWVPQAMVLKDFVQALGTEWPRHPGVAAQEQLDLNMGRLIAPPEMFKHLFEPSLRKVMGAV